MSYSQPVSGGAMPPPAATNAPPAAATGNDAVWYSTALPLLLLVAMAFVASRILAWLLRYAVWAIRSGGSPTYVNDWDYGEDERKPRRKRRRRHRRHEEQE